MKEVCILSKNELFIRYLKQELLNYVQILHICEGEGELPLAEAYICDRESMAEIPKLSALLVSIAWQEEMPQGYTGLWLDRPFRISRLRAMLGLEKTDIFELPLPMPTYRAVLMDGKTIKLTESEYRLYHVLYEAQGEFVSRDTLHKTVWKGEGDIGIVNVYIHYLRQKLEKNGKRMIISARTKGYAVRKEE